MANVRGGRVLLEASDIAVTPVAIRSDLIEHRDRIGALGISVRTAEDILEWMESEQEKTKGNVGRLDLEHYQIKTPFF